MLPTPRFYLLDRTLAYVKNRVSVHCEAENFVFLRKLDTALFSFFCPHNSILAIYGEVVSIIRCESRTVHRYLPIFLLLRSLDSVGVTDRVDGYM